MSTEEQNQNEQEAPIIDPEVPNYGTSETEVGESSSQNGLLGPVIGIIVIALVFILGGLYLWGTTLKNNEPLPTPTPIERPTAEENNEPESANAEADVEIADTVSTSDTIEAIEADVDATTDLDEIDTELNAIEAELEAALNEAP